MRKLDGFDVILGLLATVLVLVVWAAFAGTKHEKVIRQTITQECSHLEGAEYSGCRAKVLDSNGWHDPVVP